MKLTVLTAYPDGTRFNLENRVLLFNLRQHFILHTQHGTPECETIRKKQAELEAYLQLKGNFIGCLNMVYG